MPLRLTSIVVQRIGMRRAGGGTGSASDAVVSNHVATNQTAGGLASWWESLRPSFRQVRVAGVEARYSCRGSGPPLLLLASPLVRARTYEHAVRSLSRSFTVVCVELPGAGLSSRLREPWTAGQYAEWTLELIRHLPLAAPIVVGHGAAAEVAAELARLAPDEIGGVVLADAPPSFSASELRAVPDMLLNALRHRGTFVEHVKNAWSSVSLGSTVDLLVPLLVANANHQGGAFRGVQADAEPFTAAIRRFVASVRRTAHGGALKSPVFAT